mmetsp:Transcript_1565/g.2188  ORF Transcript_1565/g.2188 Transcript_1565/m.2188 type:complete len:104 (+) Transcript_1565:564-875(+)
MALSIATALSSSVIPSSFAIDKAPRRCPPKVRIEFSPGVKALTALSTAKRKREILLIDIIIPNCWSYEDKVTSKKECVDPTMVPSMKDERIKNKEQGFSGYCR